MEREDLKTGTSNSADEDRKESIRPVAFGEGAFTRDDDRDLVDRDDTSNDENIAQIPGDDNLQSNSFTASTRFGDEINDAENSVFSGRDTDSGSTATMASSRFGEELAQDEPGSYSVDSKKMNSVDDLTDDNDALTDNTDSTESRTVNETDEDKNLWEKLKDKAEGIGQGIKKAFD